MKKILILIISTLLFTSCHKKSVTPKVRESNRTVLAYFLTDELSELKDNVELIFKGLQSTKQASTVLIYWDNKDGSLDKPSILKFASDGKGSVNGVSVERFKRESSTSYDLFELISGYADIKSYAPNHASTDKNVITAVLKDMISMSPSNSYGLIFGSHAEAWIPSPKAKVSSRALASTYENQIDIIDLNEALTNVDKKFDYILMDACMMANIEVVYELQNRCKYFIGSPMEVPAKGFPYLEITPYLFSDNVADYTTKVCEEYTKYHTQLGAWGNCIAIDCGEITQFTREVRKYVEMYNPASFELYTLQPYHSSIINLGGYNGLSYDILDFVNKVSGNNASSSFKSQLNRTIIAKSFVTSSSYYAYPSFENVDVAALCGMGMYVPISIKPEWNHYIDRLQWGADSGWSKFMDDNKF